MDTFTIKNYNLKPSFIEREGGTDLRKFQVNLRDFVSNSHKGVAILDAPTGSGKTYAFRNLRKSGKVIIVIPNNLLGEELRKDIGDDAFLLNRENIEDYRLKVLQNQQVNYKKMEIIEQVFLNYNYIVTNPTVYYYILLNFYSEGSREDMISRIFKYNIETIIFDEFHVYSIDQIHKIAASTVMIPKRIKKIFSSATVPPNFRDFCISIFGQEMVEEIRIIRKYEKTENNDILQGPISLKIFNGNAIDLIRENPEILEKGKWVMILDSIRNMVEVANCLSKWEKYSNSFKAISAYFDPTYSAYREIREKENNTKIIVSSNIIEQGINMDKSFTNFIIEPGVNLQNLIQRIGRVGRGIESESQIYLCIPNGIGNIENNIDNIDQFITFAEKLNFGFNDTKFRMPRVFSVGVYVELLMERLSDLAAEVIESNLSDFDIKVRAGYYSCKNVFQILSNEEGLKKIKKNCFMYIKELKEWWIDYTNTVYDFIPPNSGKVDILDSSFRLDNNFLKTQYDEIWINKNKNILEKSENGFIVGNFKEKVNYDFEVKIKNLPEGKTQMKYNDIAFDAYRIIVERLKNFLDDIECRENENFIKFIDDVIKCAKAVAGIERLAIEVVYD